MLDASLEKLADTPDRSCPVTFPSGPAMLSGTLFLPEGAPKGSVVINPATGVPQRFYHAFARWLAQDRGFACLTFDYCDYGLSHNTPLRQSRVTMADWALIDQPAAREFLRAQVPGVPLWVIGHSLGGMLGSLQPGIEHIDRMICVCSGAAYHRDHPWPYQGLARLFWFGHAPLLTKLMGYLPGRATGFGENLPATVYWQWRKWCTNPRFYFDELGQTLPQADWSRSKAPVDMFTFDDDVVCPPSSVHKLSQIYGGVARVHQLTPADYGLTSVGHLNAFARRNSALWPALLEER